MKQYLAKDGVTWTDSYDEAGLWDLPSAGDLVLQTDRSTCIILDASGYWLVVSYEEAL